MSTVRRVFVYGGRGALGSTCIAHFKKRNWWVGSIDLKENEEADVSIILDANHGWQEQETSLINQVEAALENNKLDAVICVAGGWAGGNAAAKDFVKNSDLMWKQSVWSSVLAAAMAAKFLKDGGVITLTGAGAALNGTPGMIGYGLAKAAVHQLTKSLAASDSGLPKDSLAVSILPTTLDTPMNRKWMPKADTSTWTPLEFVADLFLQWTEGQNRPANGSLIGLKTENNITKLEIS